ncbi:MAG TPA: alkaline phosphatase [bacterium]|nr:alkaline phosphatase [bacterium]
MKRSLLLTIAILVSISLTACSQATFLRSGQEPGPASDRVPQGMVHAPLAKSLILFIGDGMGPEIVSLAKIYADKTMETGPNLVALSNTGTMGMATTYSANKLVTDSAAGGTALATGTKTNNGMVGVSPDGTDLGNLLEWAAHAGKSVGVITTTSVTDATPACFLTHIAARAREFDIAAQIAESRATVIMGGGLAFFAPPDRGKRTDGVDLVAAARDRGFDVVFDKEGLAAAGGKRLLGLFAAEDLPYQADRIAYETPSLPEMFERALRMLTTDPDGFVLVVEGGEIDHGEHENSLARAMAEFFEFDATIGEAMDYQRSDTTLTIVVTADHDTGAPAITVTKSGYPPTEGAADLLAPDYEYLKWISRDHTGTMVPVVARGPGEEMFTGIRDNTEINQGMVEILGLARGAGR